MQLQASPQKGAVGDDILRAPTLVLGESGEPLEVPQESNPQFEPMDVEPTPVKWEGWDKFKKWPGKVPIQPVAKPMGQSLSRMIWVAPEPPVPDQPPVCSAAAEAPPASSHPLPAATQQTPLADAPVATPGVTSPPAAAETPDAPSEAAVAEAPPAAIASEPATTKTLDGPAAVAEVPPTAIASPPAAAETPDAPSEAAVAKASPPAPTETPDAQAAVAETPDAPSEAAVAKAPTAAIASPPAPTETPDALMEAAAASLPKAPTAAAPPGLPVALMQSLPAPKKQQGESGGDVTFGPISQQAAQAWMVLLKRQSTDQFSTCASPPPAAPPATPAPATPVPPTPVPATPTPPTVPAQATVPAPETVPVQPKTNPTPQDDVSFRSGIVSRLMKMDDASLEAKMKSSSADPSYPQFLAEVDQGPLNGATLPTLVAFEFWTYEKSKISHAAYNEAPAVQQTPTPVETPAASPAHVTPPTSTSHMPSPAPTSSLTGSPTPASLAAAEAADQEDSADHTKEARACYMRYYRSVRSAKCPAPIAVKFREASADPTGQKLKALFAEYLECGENWLASSLLLTETQSNSRTDGGRWGWLTREDPLPKVME